MNSLKLSFDANRIRWVQVAAIGLFGFIAIAGLTMVYGFAIGDVAQIVAITFGVGVLSTSLGTAVLHTLRRRSIGFQVLLVVIFALLGTGLGAWAVARAMFLSQHDFAVLTVVLTTSGVALLLGAVALGKRIADAAEDLISATRRLDLVELESGTQHSHPDEFARMAIELREATKRIDDERIRIEQLERSRRDLIIWVSSDLRVIVDQLDATLCSGERVDKQSLQFETQKMRKIVDDLLELNASV